MDECRFREELVNAYHCNHFGTTGNIEGCKTCPLTAEQKKNGVKMVGEDNPTVSLSTYEHAMGRLKEMEELYKTAKDYADARLNTINCMKRQSKQKARDLCDAENRVKRLTSDNGRWKAGKGIFRDKSLKLQKEMEENIKEERESRDQWHEHAKKLENTTDRLTMEVVEWKNKSDKLRKEKDILDKLWEMYRPENIRLKGEIECKDREIRKLRIGCLGCDEVGRLELEIEHLKQALDDFHEASFSMADKQMEDEIAVLKQNLFALTDIKDRWKKVALKLRHRINKSKFAYDDLMGSACSSHAQLSYYKSMLKTAEACVKVKQQELSAVDDLWEQLRISKRTISIEVDNLASIETRGRAITEVQDGS